MRTIPMRAAAAAASMLVLASSALAQTGAPVPPPGTPEHSGGAPAEAGLRSGPPPVELQCPEPMLRGISIRCALVASEIPGNAPIAVEVIDADGTVRGRAELASGGSAPVPVTARAGDAFTVAAPGAYADETDERGFRSIPGWTALLPPVLAILFALLFRQVVPALIFGIVVGGWLAFGDPWTGLLRTLDTYILGALQDGDHVAIILFSMLLGGMVGVMSRSGGTAGLVDAMSPYATDTRRGQLVTWAMGLIVFFDDYANTLVVGNTMRPVTDRLKISREKLAYIVDSTAAPVAAVMLISTWIGYEVSMIDTALDDIGSDADAYSVFLRSIPYNFYPLLTLAGVWLVAWTGRDFGPMLRAERRARGGQLMAEGAVPASDFDGHALAPTEGKPRRGWNAAIPVGVVLVTTFVTLWISGRAALVEDGDPIGTAGLGALGVQGIGTVFGKGDSFTALLYAAAFGCGTAILLAVGQRILKLGEALEAMIAGFKSMVMAFVILTLAWAIAEVCKNLHTSDFMVSALSDRLDPRLLPTLVFLFAAFTAFATGTSWGTMGILIPLAVPSAHALAEGAGLSGGAADAVLLGTVASVLAGAIFGDHCSPISDTTVMSSMASGCDHVDHVRTQLPYALGVGGTSILLGTFPSAFGVPPWICLAVGFAVLVAALRTFGKHATAD